MNIENLKHYAELVLASMDEDFSEQKSYSRTSANIALMRYRDILIRQIEIQQQALKGLSIETGDKS